MNGRRTALVNHHAVITCCKWSRTVRILPVLWGAIAHATVHDVRNPRRELLPAAAPQGAPRLILSLAICRAAFPHRACDRRAPGNVGWFPRARNLPNPLKSEWESSSRRIRLAWAAAGREVSGHDWARTPEAISKI